MAEWLSAPSSHGFVLQALGVILILIVVNIMVHEEEKH